MERADTKSGAKGKGNGVGEDAEWEVRPGGMLVQRREDGRSEPSGPVIKVRVSYGTSQHEVAVPADATFGELKRAIAQETGLDPREQQLLFRGKVKDNEEHLHIAGIKTMSKVILMENPASREKKLEEIKNNQHISMACQAVAGVRTEVDKLAAKVSLLESAVYKGSKVADREFVVLTELFMVQLLKLDSIKAEGEAKVQRKVEVRRVQKFVDSLDTLKSRNLDPLNINSKVTSVTTQWETFDSGLGSLSAPAPKPPTTLTPEWEPFD